MTQDVSGSFSFILSLIHSSLLGDLKFGISESATRTSPFSYEATSESVMEYASS
jgi:hypothetical protein